MKKEKYRLYERYMLSCITDSAHDAGHVFRVLDHALLLSRGEKNIDRNVLIAAALLHDIGRKEQYETGEDHAIAGARKAYDYLIAQGEDESFAKHVTDCIRTHRFRSEDPPATPEAQLLYEADKLDVTGTLGIVRTLLYQGRLGEPIYSVSPEGQVLSGEEDAPSFFHEYRRKLSKIDARFRSDMGRRMAERRSVAARLFADSLFAEAAAGESGSAWRLLGPDSTARQRRVLNLAMLMAGGAALKVSREALIAGARGEAVSDQSAERFIADAARMDDMGAMGICIRLMQLGKEERLLEDFMDTEWDAAPFRTKQARNMAQTRNDTIRAFMDALRAELNAPRAEAEVLLNCLLD